MYVSVFRGMFFCYIRSACFSCLKAFLSLPENAGTEEMSTPFTKA